MSNAMRLGKRTLAGVAAGALALGMIPFVGVTAAQSATESFAVSQPDPIRATKVANLGRPQVEVESGTGLTYAGATSGSAGSTGANLTKAFGYVVTSVPSGSASPAVGTVLFSGLSGTSGLAASEPTAVDIVDDSAAVQAFSVAGTYGLTMWANTNASGTAATKDADEPSQTMSLKVGGTVTGVAVAPTTGTIAVSGAGTAFAASLTDAAGTATALLGSETISITTASTGTPTLSASSFAASANAYDVVVSSGSATEGTKTYNVSATGAATPATYTLSVVAASATATDIKLTDADQTAGTNTTGAVTMNTAKKAFTVTAKGTAGAGVSVWLSNGSGTAQAGVKVNGVSTDFSSTAQQVTAVANASGVATFDIAVASPTAGSKVAFSATSGGSAAVTVTYADPGFTATSTPLNIVAAFGQTVPVTVTVDDSFGNPGVGALVSATATYTSTPAAAQRLFSGVTGADGSVTLNITAPTTATAATVAYTVVRSNAASVPAPTSTGISYSADGGITSLTQSGLAATATAAAAAPIALPAAVAAPGAGTDDSFTVTATPQTPVTVTAPEGVYFSLETPGAWNDGASTIVVPSSSSTVTVWGTKPGTHQITMTAGGKTTSGYVTISAAAASTARNIAVTPVVGFAPPGSVTGMKVKVTDVFGNPVASAAGTLSATVSGPGYINGSLVAATLPATDAAGETAFTITVPNTETTGKVIVTVTADGVSGSSWVAQYGAADGYINGSATSTPAGVGGTAVGFPASVKSVEAELEVKADPGEKALVIEAYRSGSNVIVDGDAPGFARGDKVKISVQKWNKDTKKWRKAKVLATVQVKKDESFAAVVSIKGKVRVQAISGDVKSKKVEVKK